MIILTVKHLVNNHSVIYKLLSLSDISQIADDFGPQIFRAAGDAKSLHSAARGIAQYLSRHHLSVEVDDSDDHEEIYNPDVDQPSEPGTVNEKLKDLLEGHELAGQVDISEYHTLNSATHRWK